jgi:hypothetical protein
MESLERVCTTCKFCLRADYGYSNWTVEGTSLGCLKGLNPALEGEDAPWREPSPKLVAALDVAQRCSWYRAGAPATLDVDQEGIPWDKPTTPQTFIDAGYTDDLDVAQLLQADYGRGE